MSRYREEEDKHLVAYIATNASLSGEGRFDNKLYRRMVENESWAKARSWSTWREHYKENQDYFDSLIDKYQNKAAVSPSLSPSSPSLLPSSNSQNHYYSSKDDEHLVAFLAEIAPPKSPKNALKYARSGEFVYHEILSDLEKYPWASAHTWQGWQERYINYQESFDEKITQYQMENRIVQSPVIPQTSGKDGDYEVYGAATGEGDHLDHERQITYENPARNWLKRRHSEHSGEQSTDASVPPAKRRKYAHIDSLHCYSSGDTDHLPRPLFQNKSSSDSVQDALVHNKDPNNGYVVERNVGKCGVLDGTIQDDRSLNIGDTPLITIAPLDQESFSSKTAITTPPALDTSGPSARDAASLHPDLPTPLSDGPCPIPGGYPEIPSLDVEIDNTLGNVSGSAACSHHPTPPPTSAQSDKSIKPPCFEPISPRLPTVTQGEPHDGLSSQLLDIPALRNDVRSRDIPGPSMSGSASQRAAFKSSEQSIYTRPVNPKLRSRPSSSLSLSNGTFSSPSPAPQTKEVIHGIPKNRRRSFRNNDRIRTRSVILRRNKTVHQDVPQKYDNEGHDKSVTSWTSDKQTADRLPHPVTKPATFGNKSHHMAPDAIDSPTTRGPTNIPESTASMAFDRIPAEKCREQAVGVDDVFAATTTPLSSNHNRRDVVGGLHLPPEASIGLKSPQIETSTPVLEHPESRDRNRRRTFAGLDRPRGLPDIDLLAQLTSKRTKSRSPSMVWTRGSPDITVLPKRERQITPPSLLSDIERAVAFHGPPRTSVIPIVAGSEDGSAGLSLLERQSPSLSRIVMQEGLAAMFKRMEENHGFSAGVVRQVWLQQNMDLLAADKKLLRMRIAAEMAANSDGEEDPSHLSTSISRIAKEPIRRLEDASVVQYSPTTQSFVSSDTGYTPPVRSRAGHYRRFLEQGRHWEARQREIELASRSSLSRVTTPQPADAPTVPIWGKKEDDILRTSSEDELRRLAKKFGEKFLRRKSLALLMLDE